MDGDVIQPHIQVTNLIQGDTAYLPRQVQGQHTLVAAHLLRGAVQHGEELLLLQGFHEVMERGHVIALGNIIGISGNENDLDDFILPANAPGQLHAVHAAHLDVQQQHVVALILRVVK